MNYLSKADAYDNSIGSGLSINIQKMSLNEKRELDKRGTNATLISNETTFVKSDNKIVIFLS